jgi:hypothetical protein
MAIIEQYRQSVKELLTEYAIGWDTGNEVESQLMFDAEHDHYQWSRVGWKGSERIYHCVLHFDIKDGKVWLQQNMTDQDPAAKLVEMGVPREDIVLGFQPLYARPYTDYGVA